MKLRWALMGTRNDITSNELRPRLKAKYCYGFVPESSEKDQDALFVLQQYWKDNCGGGEWRSVDIDWDAG